MSNSAAPEASAYGSDSRKSCTADSLWIVLAIGVIAAGTAICLSDPRWRSLAITTFSLSGSVAAIAIPIGTLLAWALARTDMPLRRTFSLLLAVMLFLPLTIQAAAWRSGFGPQGVFTLGTGGAWTAGQTVWLDGLFGAIWVHAAAAIPWVVLIVGLSARLVRPELEEQALLDGSTLAVLLRVTLPRSLAAILVATVWVVVRAAGEMVVTDLFTVRTFAEEIYTQNSLGASGSRLVMTGVPSVLICGGLFTLAVVACRRMVPRQQPPAVRPRVVFALRRWRWPVAIVVATGVMALVGTPLLSLCTQAGMVVGQAPSGRVRHWSLAKFAEVLAASPRLVAGDAGWSLLIAGCAATAALLIGVVLAWQARRGDLRSAPAIVTVALAIAVPRPMIGAAIIALLNRGSHPLLVHLYDHSILAPWIAQTIHCLPLAILIPWFALRSVSTDTLHSAAIEGAGPVTRLLKIAAASRLPALAFTWLVAFAIATGELASTVMVVPPGVTTLTLRIFEWLHYGANDQVAGVCLWMSALPLAIGFCLFRLGFVPKP